MTLGYTGERHVLKGPGTVFVTSPVSYRLFSPALLCPRALRIAQIKALIGDGGSARQPPITGPLYTSSAPWRLLSHQRPTSSLALTEHAVAFILQINRSLKFRAALLTSLPPVYSLGLDLECGLRHYVRNSFRARAFFDTKEDFTAGVLRRSRPLVTSV
ncbi:hypothetical protein NDU88_001637 [Pleurodeles waltl]|uniref:Uncharacterized protein n=1 Tax=Pleurodeles waltl TaxID=8319 RepID=A0AAV7MV77_PLEWA|nr:hypothetical protein NDU88_001637 [Pleurodeles waltl]